MICISHDVYSSLVIFEIIKSRRVRGTGHVTRMGKVEEHAGFGGEI
jgi:hypothetical protein